MSRRLLALPALLAAAALALAGCSAESPADAADAAAPAAAGADAAAADLTITDADGSETTLEAMPQRVAVLEYAALDTLHTLGLDSVVVATPQKTLPASLQSFGGGATADAGTLKEPDFEAIAAADPDLILVGGRSVDVMPQLAEIAPTVNVQTDSKDMVASALERAEDLAGLFGRQAEVAPIADGIRAKAEAIAADAAGRSAMVLMSSGGKLSAYGPGSRYGIFFDQLGFGSAADVQTGDGHGQEVSFELVAQANPDVIFAIDRDAAIGQSGEAAQAVLDNDLVNGTTAAKDGHIIYLDGQNWYLVTGGLTTMDSMLGEISSGLAK